mgnify:CR=1 FL=1
MYNNTVHLCKLCHTSCKECNKPEDQYYCTECYPGNTILKIENKYSTCVKDIQVTMKVFIDSVKDAPYKF